MEEKEIINRVKSKLFDLEHDCWNSRNYSNMFAFTSEDIEDAMKETIKYIKEGKLEIA